MESVLAGIGFGLGMPMGALLFWWGYHAGRRRRAHKEIFWLSQERSRLLNQTEFLINKLESEQRKYAALVQDAGRLPS